LTDDLFLIWGGDFYFMDANMNYLMTDELIQYMNEKHGDRYHIQYATPSDYVRAVKKHNETKWPMKYDDMMPYSD